MYRGSSPIFDVPEFPPLRRVKPLPKRRRTSGEALSHIPDASQYTPGMIPADGAVDMSTFGLNLPLPQYYMPMFGGVQDLFRIGNDDPSVEYPGGFAVPVGTTDEEDHGDGDYVDHLQQPGNTKKRKVPAAHHHHHHHHQHHAGGGGDPLLSPVGGGDEEADERGQADAAAGGGVEPSDVGPAVAAPAAQPLTIKKNRSSAATLAGLQHKELLKTRKRQLAAVLGALSHGDTLALDQALSARYSSLAPLAEQNGKENDPGDRPRRRWSRRRMQSWEPTAPLLVPVTEFTFVCPSPTSERLISTREEVAVLHSHFEAELSRQAAKAAEVARQHAAAESASIAKRTNRNQQRSRSSGANPNSGCIEGGGTGVKTRTLKKKKRSALANASNPHHLRNYVPSRIPHSGQTLSGGVQSTGHAQNTFSPLPIRFLSTEIPPRRRKKTTTGVTGPIPSLNQPEDEWICALCEYNLFYGEEGAFRRAVRSRKKILVRRRRARERAAAAASGQKATATVEKGTGESVETGMEEEVVGEVDGQNKPAKYGNSVSKKERDKAVGII